MVTPAESSIRWERPLAAALLMPALLVAGLALLAPLAANIFFSLYDGRIAEPFARFVGLAHYRALATDPAAWAALGRGVWYAFASSTAQVMLALAAAATLAPHGLIARWLRLGVLVPVLIPPAAYVAAFKMTFDASYGPGSAMLAAITGHPVALLTEGRLLPVAIGLTTLQFFPLSFLLLLERIRRVPAPLLRVSAIDALGPWQRFVTVILPAVLPLFLALWALRFSLTFGKFDVLYFLGGTSALYQEIETPPLYVFREALAQGRLAYGAAACGLLVATGLVALVLYFAIGRFLKGSCGGFLWRTLTLRRRPSATAVSWQRFGARAIAAATHSILLLTVVGPVGLMVFGSLTAGFPLRVGGFTLRHYSELFSQFAFGGPLLRSAGVTTVVVFLCLAAALPLACFVASFRMPALRRLGAVGVATYGIPAILLVFGTLLLLGRGQLSGTFGAVVLGLVGFCLPLTCVTLVSFGDDDQAPDAGRANADRIALGMYFQKIFVGNRRGALGAAGALCFAACWSDYLFSATLGGSRVRTAVVAFQDIYQGAVIPWGVLMAAAVTISLPTVIAGLCLDHALAQRKADYE